MTKITVKTDCGNAPKMEFIKKFNIAFAEGNLEFLFESVAEDIVWNLMGDKIIKGRESFMAELVRMKSEKTSELILDRVLSHGREGAANGTIIFENGSQFAFADFYEFNSAKGNRIKEITSYVIEI